MVWFGVQGDMNEAIEPYLKDDRNVEKVSPKMHKQINFSPKRDIFAEINYNLSLKGHM